MKNYFIFYEIPIVMTKNKDEEIIKIATDF